MSVIIAEGPELHLVQQSAARYASAPRELFAALQGAQLTAYLLSYGDLPGVQAYSNRAPLPPVPASACLDAAGTLARLRLFEYNTLSNGGNACLPVGAARRLDTLMHSVAVQALRESGAAVIHRCEITRHGTTFLVLPDGDRDLLLADGTRLPAREAATPEEAVDAALALARCIHAAQVTAGVLEPWEVRPWEVTPQVDVAAQAAD